MVLTMSKGSHLITHTFILLTVFTSIVNAALPSSTTFFPSHQRLIKSLSNNKQQNKYNHHPCPIILSSIRGGAIFDSDDEYDSDYDSDDEDDWDDDDELFGLDSADFDAAEDDFSEESTLTRAVAAFSNSPPFTKLYLSASFAATMLGYLTQGNDFPPYLLFDWKATFFKLQFWRPITAFLNFGPLNIGYLMTAQFVWTYMATLERLNHDAPYDFWWMIIFGGTSMVLGYTFLKISPRFLGHNLSTFLVYVWSRYHEGVEVNMFELFNTRAEMLPWFFLAQTFLLEGEFPILDLLGIVFGHVYHYCRSVGLGKAPKVISDWYLESDDAIAKSIREEYKRISSDFELQQ